MQLKRLNLDPQTLTVEQTNSIQFNLFSWM